MWLAPFTQKPIFKLGLYYMQAAFLTHTHHNWTIWICEIYFRKNKKNKSKPFSDGSLGSRNDEERRETRYVMWIAGLSESSNLWTQIALGASRSEHTWFSLVFQKHPASLGLCGGTFFLGVAKFASLQKKNSGKSLAGRWKEISSDASR